MTEQTLRQDVTDPTLAEATLADLVAANPARAVVLDRLGLDFCCHGQRRLADACEAAGLNPTEVAAALDADAAPAGWSGGGRASLAAHVTTIHHTYLHHEMPELTALAAKVTDVHAARHPELGQVADLVARIAGELSPHLATEEQLVFPAIAALAPGTAGGPELAAHIQGLVADHMALGELLSRLRDLTGDYTVPSDGCASYRMLYQRLQFLEADTHLHIHVENNVLFPAALVEAV